MTAKEFTFSDEARDKILKGVNTLANAVRVTLGPRGRNVVIENNYGGSPHVTKDGVTVAKAVELEDQFENMGAQLVKQVASKTADVAGDGTTTATVLAQAMITDGSALVTNKKSSPTDIKRGMDYAVNLVIGHLKSVSKEVTSSEEITQVGNISSNGDVEVGKMIAEAMSKVGNEGVITLEEGQTAEMELSVVNGYQFDKGYLTPHFVTNEKLESVLESALILVTSSNITNATNVLIPIMEATAKTYPQRPLLIIADSVDGEALPTLVLNHVKGAFKCCPVKAPGFGDRKKEMLGDIATLTGATLISDEVGLKLENFQVGWLGAANKVITTSNSCTIVEGQGAPEEIEKRVSQIRTSAGMATGNWDREKQEERLAKLVGGVAVISVGAATEAEMKEKKDRVEDALSATRAAVQEGVVPGGGVALLRAATVLENLDAPVHYADGIEIVKRAMKTPLARIVENSGLDPAEVSAKVLESSDTNYGYNAQTEEFEDLTAAGVIDPTKVVRCALQNAVSVAGLVLTTECMIVNKKEEQPHPGAPHMGM